MNKLQKCELELLKQFIQCCRQLNLTYYLVCGSALGAVKYSGFIPWDDDIDVAMHRKDYEIFCRCAPKILPQYIFVQTYKSDPRFPSIYAKLRNSNTTCIESGASGLAINHGIFIDVFPLDGYPQNTFMQHCLEVKKLIYMRLLGTVYSRQSLWKELIVRLFRLLGTQKHSFQLAEAYTKMISRYPPEDSKLIVNHGNWQGKSEYFPKAVFGKGIEAIFEGITVAVPFEYEVYLRQKYGDYHRDPPLEQQKSHHSFTVIDTERPYWEYTGEHDDISDRN